MHLECLGIDHYFKKEIKESLDYIYRYWDAERGMGWARCNPIPDVNDTTMGLRILRLHGYNVSSGEKIMEEAKTFTINYLQNGLAKNNTFDKWAIKKDLPGEVEYALKMLYVSNEKYLELAKLDFNMVQALQQKETQHIVSRWRESGFNDLTFTYPWPMEMYFSMVVSMFEPKFTASRIAYAKTSCLVVILDDLYDTHGSLDDLKLFFEAVQRWDISMLDNVQDNHIVVHYQLLSHAAAVKRFCSYSPKTSRIDHKGGIQDWVVFDIY
eukprot:Gb_41622 [translate_table: standard]